MPLEWILLGWCSLSLVLAPIVGKAIASSQDPRRSTP
jgi:hypothetical protein